MEGRSHDGRCHCGSISFSYKTALSPEKWWVRSCLCSFCRAHGARYASDPDGSVRFSFSAPDRVVRYRFGFRSADFLLCGRCGVLVGAITETPRASFGIVNVNALLTPPDSLPEPKLVSYDGESGPQRQSRRASRWTPLAGAA